MTGRIVRPGGRIHSCREGWPRVDLATGHGTVWRCWCGQRWLLRTRYLGPGSWQGCWEALGAIRWHLWWRWRR